MKIVIHRFAVLLGAMLLASVWCGCETTSSSENDVRINPSSARIRKGESITFTASGGFEYRWSLGNTTIGTLSNVDGSSTTYTSVEAPTTNEALIQTLVVNSTIEGSPSGTSTNTGSAFVQSAEALITHIE